MERPVILLSQWLTGLIALGSTGATALTDATDNAVPILLFLGAIAATATFTWALARVYHSRESRLEQVEKKLDKLLDQKKKG